jgi:hypothetical protein
VCIGLTAIFAIFKKFLDSSQDLGSKLPDSVAEPGASIADEDIYDAIVDDSILAEVKLSQRTREFIMFL